LHDGVSVNTKINAAAANAISGRRDFKFGFSFSFLFSFLNCDW